MLRQGSVRLDLQPDELKCEFLRQPDAAGKRVEAEKIITELDELAKQGRFMGLTNMALVHAGLGENEQAIQALLDAREQNNAERIWFKVDPRFDGLRSDPRLRETLPGLKNP